MYAGNPGGREEGPQELLNSCVESTLCSSDPGAPPNLSHQDPGVAKKPYCLPAGGQDGTASVSPPARVAAQRMSPR